MDNSTTCGGCLKSTYGRIEYKPLEEVATTERCVWILQPVGFTYADVFLNPDIPAPEAGS